MRAPITNPNGARIVALAAAHRLPAIYGDQLYTDAGGLAAYAANHVDLWRRAAAYVDKILKGTRPADIRVELPPRFDFIANLKTARELSITLPEGIMLQVTDVIPWRFAESPGHEPRQAAQRGALSNALPTRSSNTCPGMLYASLPPSV